MREMIERMALDAVRKVADGRWHNLCGHERQMGDEPVSAVWKEWIGFGFAAARNWVEIDDAWARITPAGRAALKGEEK